MSLQVVSDYFVISKPVDRTNDFNEEMQAKIRQGYRVESGPSIVRADGDRNPHQLFVALKKIVDLPDGFEPVL